MRIDTLQRNPYNPRREIQEANLEGLADSIRKNGVIQPIIIREKLGKYEIIAGERRWLAAKMAGLQEIPVRLIEVSDEEAMQFALVENLQREDLTPLQIANGLNELIKRYALTHEQVAEALGWSRVAVTNKLRLLNLPIWKCNSS
jgi:ParB family chromosome partitioning protein